MQYYAGSSGVNGFNSAWAKNDPSKAMHFKSILSFGFVPLVYRSRTSWAGRAVDQTVKPMMSESTTLDPEPRLL